MTTVDDTQTLDLLARAAAGDPAASESLLSLHRDRLRRMVSVRLDARVRQRLDPSDVVQETLVEAAHKLAAYAESRPVPFYPWLRRLAWENLVRLHERHIAAARRSVAREIQSLPSLPDESTDALVQQLSESGLAPDGRMLRAELKARVTAGLAQLKPTDREVLELRFLEQLSNDEIALALGVASGTVRVRVTRALARLARRLDGANGSAGG